MQYNSSQTFSVAQDALAKITSALQLAKQATDANSELAEQNFPSSSSLTKEAEKDIEDAIADEATRKATEL